MTEKYQPTEEEMARAEAMMFPHQAKLTEKREQMTHQLRELGVEGLLIKGIGRGDGSGKYPDWDIIEGELNGHEIYAVSAKHGIEGKIDGHLMSRRDAVAFWHKYYDIASAITREEVQAAARELSSQPPYNPENALAAEALKDIL